MQAPENAAEDPAACAGYSAVSPGNASAEKMFRYPVCQQGFQRVGAEPPPSRPQEALHSLRDTDYNSSPRP